MHEISPSPARDPAEGRWELLRDVFKFQLKLLVDGLRDVLMSPVSLVAALGGLMLESRRPRRYFDRTLEFGRRTEEWINLFDRYREPADPGLDELFARLESRIVEQYQRGGLTSSAKRAVDTSLDRLNRVASRVREQAAGRVAGADQAGDDAGT